ncbi:MAG TPA: type II toxin-antitoxin system HipA family toxin [Terracidiphilus sp.]|jgi:serine/threonine-protein kinase HipA|nr:type II toxin-antitoxin system HipA family toxin [Terracidiphilus sp.]
MKLNVHVLDEHVAVLEQVGDFKSVLTYIPEVSAEKLVSLTMPVRTESYVWDDELHPIFRMNLPEGYLLQVLQEEFGPHVGASPIALLSVIGRNMVGRLKVAPPGAALDEPVRPIEVAELLKGDNSEEAFSRLVREHAKSGVSGILPKFLDAETQKQQGATQHKGATLLTHHHIIKGSSARLPYATANEHLCMKVVTRVIESAKTELSQDGNVLLVHRFDVDEKGKPFRAMEDFCALLGLRPQNKYETTWERIAKAVRTYVDGKYHYETFQKLTAMLLLTYALRNADCHSKNLALLYTSRTDARLAPAYDFLTTSVYAGYRDNPPGIMFGGKKTWLPGKTLAKFITANFGIPDREQKLMVERISDAIADTAPAVRETMKGLDGFRDIGKGMLAMWSEGVNHLRDTRMYGLSPWKASEAFEGISDAPKLQNPTTVVGRSELLAGAGKRKRN